jgi:uncharacterized protein (TIGR02246 family)
MRRSHLLVALAVLALPAGLAEAKGDAASKGARAVDEAWQKAARANDLDALVGCYAKDGVFWMQGAPTARGHAAIRAMYAGLLGANTIADARLENAVYEDGGDLSVGWGDYVVILKPKAGGDPVTLLGRFTVVAKEEDGRWVYLVDHASDTPAAPPVPATPPAPPSPPSGTGTK